MTFAFLAILVPVLRVGSALPLCKPATKGQPASLTCTNITSPCSTVQQKLKRCTRDEKECLTLGEQCDEACGRCVPVCSPENIVELSESMLQQDEWGSYCRLPECPRPSAYFSAVLGCNDRSDYEYELSTHCIYKNKQGYNFHETAIKCPRKCRVCNDTTQPPPPTQRPTSSPGPRRKRVTTKKGSAGSFLFGALYVEIAVVAFLLLVLVILIQRKLRKKKKNKAIKRANRAFKRL